MKTSRPWKLSSGPVFVPPGQILTVNLLSGGVFRGYGLITMGVLKDFYILDILVDGVSQMPKHDRDIPASAFYETWASGNTQFDTCREQISVVVQNAGAKERSIVLEVKGVLLL